MVQSNLFVLSSWVAAAHGAAVFLNTTSAFTRVINTTITATVNGLPCPTVIPSNHVSTTDQDIIIVTTEGALPSGSGASSGSSCTLAAIPGWDSFCPEVAGSVFAARQSSHYLGEITLNWTLAGLEDALLEAARYVYDNHLDLLELLDDVPPFAINVYQENDFSMTAVFSSDAYNSADYALMPNSAFGKRAGVGNSVVLHYDPSKLQNLGYPAVAGYEYLDLTNPAIHTPRNATYTHNVPGASNKSRVYFPSIINQCVDFYTQTLIVQHPELRQSPLTITIGEYRKYNNGIYENEYSYSCYFQNSTFNENDYMLSSNDYHYVAVLERDAACVFDTDMVTSPPACWWTEYSSKSILENIAATIPEAPSEGFFDALVRALGHYANDGEQGYLMECSFPALCVLVNEPPGAYAEDKQIGSWMITRAVIYHWTQLKNLDAVFTSSSDWASALLPGIVAKLTIPQTESKPRDDDSFDFFGFFKLVVGYTPLGASVKKVGDVVDGIGFFANMIPATPKTSPKYPQPDLFDISTSVRNTFDHIKDSYTDAFQRAIGNNNPHTRKTNFMKLFDYHGPPSLLNTTVELYKDSVEVVKPLMIDYIISNTMQATKAVLMKLYDNDDAHVIDYYAKRGASGVIWEKDTPMSVKSTDNSGNYRIQYVSIVPTVSSPIVYHHNDCEDGMYKGFGGYGLVDTDNPERWHFAYRGLATVQSKLTYFDPKRAYQASIDCQNKRTNGQFPLETNGNKLYPRPTSLDYFTDITSPGACLTFNLPVVSNKDFVAKEACRPWGNSHKGTNSYSGLTPTVNLDGTCENSFFTPWGPNSNSRDPVKSYSSMGIWALERTGFITDIGDVQNDFTQC